MKQRKKVNIWITAIFLIAIGAFAVVTYVVGAGSPDANVPTHPEAATIASHMAAGPDDILDIAMVTFPGYAPLYLAKEKGFFGDLDVALHRIEDIATIRSGMASKRLDAYLATTDIALDTNKRPQGVAIWAIDESSGGDGVVVSEKIKTLKNLEGKEISAELGFPPYFTLLYQLKQAGMSLKDVKIRDMSTQDAASAFVSGSVDVAAIYEPYLSQAIKDRPGSRVLISTNELPGLVVDSIFVREAYLKRDRDLILLINGWRRALAHIKANPQESYEIMARAFKMPVHDFKDIAGSVKWLDLEENTILFGAKAKPGLLYENFVKVREILAENRSSVYHALPEQHLNPKFVHKLNQGL